MVDVDLYSPKVRVEWSSALLRQLSCLQSPPNYKYYCQQPDFWLFSCTHLACDTVSIGVIHFFAKTGPYLKLDGALCLKLSPSGDCDQRKLQMNTITYTLK